MTAEPRLEVVVDKPAEQSPLARLTAAHKAREQAHTMKMEVTGRTDGLVAELGVIDDEDAAAAGLRLTGGLVERGVHATLGDAALVVSTSVIGLYSPNADGDLEQITDPAGHAVKFDEQYGAAIGVPDINTPDGAVFAAFTRGPKVDAQALMMFATAIALWASGLNAEETVKGS